MYSNSNLLRGLVFASLSIVSSLCSGQQTLIYSEPDASFAKAKELYDAQKYSAAKHLFEEVSRSTSQFQSTEKIDADYFAAICSMYLFHEDAEKNMTRFIRLHPQSPRVHKIDFLIGNYEYRKQKYKDAVTWYGKADPSYLDKDEVSEFYFKRGYSYFHENKLDSAKHDFFEVKDAGATYSPEATYYYSYIAYRQKNYQTAITGFLALKKDPHFGTVVPYYITQLYYLQGDYDNAVQFAIPLIDSAKNPAALTNSQQIIKMIAESYYRLHKYSDAITYFQKYANGSSLPPIESYELGFSYFSSGKYKEAVPWLQTATYGNDSLAQNADYYLAVTYLKMGNKSFASNAFREVYKMNFDPKLKEDALLNYAKLAYELSFDPFDEAIKAFNEYLTNYPNSAHKEEVYRYLVKVYQSTKNYPAALVSMEKIKNWDPELQAVYQKLTYYRAVDLFNNNKLDLALNYFENSLKYDFDQKLRLAAFYWKSEALYRQKKYDDAIEAYKLFMVQPQAFSTPEYNQAQYGIGYAYFEQKNYDYAGLYFRKYTIAETDDKKRMSDAFNRIGDGYFVQQNYEECIPYYDKNMELNFFDADYAAYQKAIALGILQKNEDKISTLETFLKMYPKSSYRPSGMLELANTYALANKQTQAIDEYQQVLDNYQNSPYVTQCLLQKGQIYYNMNQNDKAQAEWEEVVKRDRNSPEGAEALAHIKMLYTSAGQIQKMQDYFHTVGADLSQMALDSATFTVVKASYLGNDFGKTLVVSNAYLQKYPQGVFSTEVHFYRGEAYYKNLKKDSALMDYGYVAKMPRGFFTEAALAKAAALAFDKKDYANAINYYNGLATVAQYETNISDARLGKMRCNYQLKKYDATIGAADTVLQTAKMQQEVYAEATFLIAKSQVQKEMYDSALVTFQKVAAMTHSEMEAEAKYNIAYLEYLKGDVPASEKTIFDLVNQEPSYPQWMAKGLILLSDDYLAVHDDFQAKHTLNTVIENATDTALVGQAKRAIDKINDNEKKTLPPPVKQDMTIPFNNDNSDYDKLFKQ
jgi:tetratricopeptide (TPR) repeat protein